MGKKKGKGGCVWLALALLGCGPATRAATEVTPGIPPVEGCALGATRCAGAMPETCSGSGRWHPAYPAPCAVACVMAADGARCGVAP